MIYLEEIIKATGGNILPELKVVENECFGSVSIDSRTIKEGDIFFAIKGARFDGHDFVADALKKAKGAVINISEKDRYLNFLYDHKIIIVVNDTHKALKALATYMRKKRIKNLIGITGSNGKTTTKEILYSILNRFKGAIRNEGNLNNEFGLPLTLINSDVSEWAVLEMGASHPGDIKVLCDIALPDFGLITNAGRAHLEGFGDIKSVARTKLEILPYVKKLFLNADQELLIKEWRDNLNGRGDVITFGIKNKSDVMAYNIRLGEMSSSFRIRYKEKDFEVRLNIPGIVNVYNALAGSAVALFLGVSEDILRDTLFSFSGVKMRFQVFEKDGVRYILDAYNANPESMKEAIQELVRLKRERTIAVLGDMLELGRYSEGLHRETGKFLRSYGIDIFIAVGKEMKFAADEFSGGDNVFRVDTSGMAGNILREILRHGDTVLIKGSRGMKMEEVLNAC